LKGCCRIRSQESSTLASSIALDCEKIAGTHEQRQETGAAKAKDIDEFQDDYADSKSFDDMEYDYVASNDEDAETETTVGANTYSHVMEAADIEQKTSEDIQYTLCELHHASLDSITGDY
jgi:hypothetical protein